LGKKIRDRDWAEDVWRAWEPHHKTAPALVELFNKD